jgi:hypothetical protein
VNLVIVPEDYEPDSIRSAEEVQQSGYEVMQTDTYVNCPVVPEGTALAGGEELVQGWVKGEEVYYADFGENPLTVEPIWAFITGLDDNGEPTFVEGQNNIIDTVPGQPNYTAFWQVNMVTVPADYEPNSLRSAADVLASGYEITETDMVVNCPVTVVADAVPTTPTGGEDVTAPPAAGGGPGNGGPAMTAWPLVAGLAGLGLLFGGASLAIARRRS